MRLTSEQIAIERIERLGLWKGQFAEPLSVVPIEIVDAVPGSVCRLWFMPNQSHFVVAGEIGDTVKIIHESGNVSGFTREALVVVVRAAVEPLELLEHIKAFEDLMRTKAWQ